MGIGREVAERDVHIRRSKPKFHFLAGKSDLFPLFSHLHFFSRPPTTIMSDKENERSRSASRESKVSEKSHQSGSHKSEASRSYSRSPTPKSAGSQRSQRSASRSRS